MLRETHPRSFVILAVVFALFVLFLYGPTLTITVLSFQGPSGGLVFPMQGASTHWFGQVFQRQSIGDIGGSFDRSLKLGLIVMLLTVTISFLAGLAFRRRFVGALAFRRRFVGAGALFYIAVASLIMPSVVVSLGIGALFELMGIERNWWSSGLGAHLTWTLPFGLLIMFAVFNRFDKRFEEAARDLGASPVQTVRHVVLPIVLPSLVGVALFGFTLSYDELARSSQALGALNTLPLELQAMQSNATTPVIYALGTLTTALSLVVIGTSLVVLYGLRARQARKGTDAGKGMV
jgi:putative spermidine/putrescine transport system permease protein